MCFPPPPVAVSYRLRSLFGPQEEEVWLQTRASALRLNSRLLNCDQQRNPRVHENQRVWEVRACVLVVLVSYFLCELKETHSLCVQRSNLQAANYPRQLEIELNNWGFHIFEMGHLGLNPSSASSSNNTLTASCLPSFRPLNQISAV